MYPPTPKTLDTARTCSGSMLKRGTNCLFKVSHRINEAGPADEDLELVAACRKGDVEAFGVLVIYSSNCDDVMYI